MKNQFNLGLFLSPEREKEQAAKYLNKTTSALYQTLLFKLIDCAYEVQNNRHLSQEALDIFEEGMRQPLELIFSSYSGKFISKLSYHFEDAKAIFFKLANDKNSKVRLNIVTLMLDNPQEAVVTSVLEKSIGDSSHKVREKVADVCQRLGDTKMLGLLEKQYSVENDKSVKESLAFSIGLLKDGYVLKKMGENTFSLIVKTGEELKGTIISQDELNKHGAESIAKSIRK